MTVTGKPMTIGEFARRCRLPVSTLRYYDRIGLLVPARVDRATGYRRYTGDQLPAAVLIARLRAVGSAPADIARMLGGGPEAEAALDAERRRLAAGVSRARRALADLEDLLAHPPAPPAVTVDVILRQRMELVVLCFCDAPDDLASGVLRAVAGLRSLLRRAHGQRIGPWGAGFPLDLTDHVDAFAFAPVEPSFAHAGAQRVSLPATEVACCVHRGDPGSLALTYDAVLTRVGALGRAAAGPVIEEYLGLDEAGGDPSIRVSVPLVPRPAPSRPAEQSG